LPRWLTAKIYYYKNTDEEKKKSKGMQIMINFAPSQQRFVTIVSIHFFCLIQKLAGYTNFIISKNANEKFELVQEADFVIENILKYFSKVKQELNNAQIYSGA
jgi:hypothetical protein